MITKDLNKLTMFRTLQQVCDENADIVNSNKAFADANLVFNEKIDDILETAQAQGVVLTGITADKNVDKDNLVQAASDLAGVVFAYASKEKNNTLKASVDFSFSDFNRIKGDLLIARANSIHDIADENLAALADSDVTEASLAAYGVLINKYKKSLPANRAATSEKGTQTENLETLIKNVMDMLTEQMDMLVVQLKAKNPDFVALYFNARKIIATRTTAKKLVNPIPPNDQPK